MNFLKKHKIKIISATAAVILLVIAFILGGTPENKTNKTTDFTYSPTQTSVGETPSAVMPTQTANPTKADDVGQTQLPKSTEEPKIQTPPPSKATAMPDATQGTKDLTCTLSVRCDTVLKNMASLNPNKVGIIPQNGVIFPKTEVVFYKGESVFNLLTREMKKNKIHLEYVNTPMYNSAYIEGLANLYERDCGELSGWMYKVNGIYPKYGASQYIIKNDDIIEWVYTCDGGRDIGDDYSAKNGREQ